jgi:hypothetical protein
MSRTIRIGLLLLVGGVLSSGALLAQRDMGGQSSPASFSFKSYFGGHEPFGGFGGHSLPYSWYPSSGGPYGYLPNYRWASHYPTSDPRQDGYNSSASYEWDSVGTLMLTTSPAKSRVTLDGVLVGTSDKLGPIQLPAGEHTLHLAADGYEPSDTIVKVDKPGPLVLNVELKPLSVRDQPAPQR